MMLVAGTGVVQGHGCSKSPPLPRMWPLAVPCGSGTRRWLLCACVRAYVAVIRRRVVRVRRLHLCMDTGRCWCLVATTLSAATPRKGNPSQHALQQRITHHAPPYRFSWQVLRVQAPKARDSVDAPADRSTPAAAEGLTEAEAARAWGGDGDADTAPAAGGWGDGGGWDAGAGGWDAAAPASADDTVAAAAPVAAPPPSLPTPAPRDDTGSDWGADVGGGWSVPNPPGGATSSPSRAAAWGVPAGDAVAAGTASQAATAPPAGDAAACATASGTKRELTPPAFPCTKVEVDYEPEAEAGGQSSRHEMQLLQRCVRFRGRERRAGSRCLRVTLCRYREEEDDDAVVASLEAALGGKRETAKPEPSNSKKAGKGGKGGKGGEKYERLSPQARTLLYFQNRIARSPQQCIRYENALALPPMGGSPR